MVGMKKKSWKKKKKGDLWKMEGVQQLEVVVESRRILTQKTANLVNTAAVDQVKEILLWGFHEV